MGAFFAMGKYAGFVWPSYAVSLAVLGGAAWLSWRAYVRARALLAQLDKNE